MSKMVGRIPASQVHVARTWLPPAVGDGKIIRVKGRLTEGKISRAELARMHAARQKPAQGVASATDPAVSPADAVAAVEPVASAVSAPESRLTPADDQATAAEPPANGQQQPGEQPAEVTADTASGAAGNAAAPPVEHEPEPHPDPAQQFQAGYDEGFQEGREAGFQAGEQAGYQAGEKKGLAQGEAAGRQQAEATFAQLVASQKELMSGLVSALRNPVAEIENDLLATLAPLVRGVAEAVIFAELKQHPEQIRQIVQAGLDAMPHGAGRVEIVVNPQHAEFVRDMLTPDDVPVEIVPDAGLAPGSCKINAPHTQLDNTLSKRLRQSLASVFAPELLDSPPTEAGLSEEATRLMGE
ncbi:MAG: hypothetical protein KDI36_05680 [Pseudomonadales bacterium]|nr:hypothetical protein [Pseudomonadales bacterium]